MQYTLDSGRVITIGDNDIRNLMDACGCSKEEAIDIWLTDHDFIVNQEQEKLDKSAKNAGFRAESGKKTSKKPRTVKISAEKQQFFNEIASFLTENGYNFEILKENKLFSVKVGDKTLKLDIVEQRPSKN